MSPRLAPPLRKQSRTNRTTKRGGDLMAGVLPTLTLAGVGDYLGLALGVSLGFAIFYGPMQSIQNSLKKNGA